MGLFNFVSGWKSALIDKPLDQRMNEAGRAAVEEAMRLVPVDTGQLRASIGYTYIQSEKRLQIHADMPYAVFVEYGTAQMKAQPYLRPALNAIGRIWGGSTEIQFLNVAQPSGRPTRRSSQAAMEHNARVFHQLGKGASRRAKVSIGGRIRRYHRYSGPPMLNFSDLRDLPP